MIMWACKALSGFVIVRSRERIDWLFRISVMNAMLDTLWMSQGHVWNIPVALAVENSAKSVKTSLHAQGTTSAQNVPRLQKRHTMGIRKKATSWITFARHAWWLNRLTGFGDWGNPDYVLTASKRCTPKPQQWLPRVNAACRFEMGRGMFPAKMCCESHQLSTIHTNYNATMPPDITLSYPFSSRLFVTTRPLFTQRKWSKTSSNSWTSMEMAKSPPRSLARKRWMKLSPRCQTVP